MFAFLGLHFLSFWPFNPSFSFILAFWAFMCFHFGLLILHFWLFGRSCAFILAFWAFHFLIFVFWAFILFCSLRLILVFWAFMCFYHGVLAMPLAIPLDTLVDTHECQKCTPSLDAHARLSLHGNVLAFSCIFQFVPAFVLMAVALYLKRSSHSMC